jgi:TetR/AcrR family transcriptional repressor of mexJK operon
MAMTGADRRGRGRPPTRNAAETRRIVVEAATMAFLEDGFVGASTAAIARRAGVSKRTVYEIASTKSDLLAMVIAERRAIGHREAPQGDLAALGAKEALTVALRGFAWSALTEEVVRLHQLAIGQVMNAPELAAVVYREGPERTNLEFLALIENLERLGLLEIREPGAAVSMLLGFVHEKLRAAVFRALPLPNKNEIEVGIEATIAMFLSATRFNEQ